MQMVVSFCIRMDAFRFQVVACAVSCYMWQCQILTIVTLSGHAFLKMLLWNHQ